MDTSIHSDLGLVACNSRFGSDVTPAKAGVQAL